MNPRTAKIMFVVTAGNSNRGHYSAFDAANAARGYGIDVYAVGIGKSVDPSQQQVSFSTVFFSVLHKGISYLKISDGSIVFKGSFSD